MRPGTPTEHQEQCALLEWVSLYQGRYPELEMLFAVPNGGQRHIAVARKLKAEGVRAGVPDLFLPVARNGYHGLFVEMKTRTGKTSPAQRAYFERLRENGYRVAVCRGWESAAHELTLYLGVGE